MQAAIDVGTRGITSATASGLDVLNLKSLVGWKKRAIMFPRSRMMYKLGIKRMPDSLLSHSIWCRFVFIHPRITFFIPQTTDPNVSQSTSKQRRKLRNPTMQTATQHQPTRRASIVLVSASGVPSPQKCRRGRLSYHMFTPSTLSFRSPLTVTAPERPCIPRNLE